MSLAAKQGDAGGLDLAGLGDLAAMLDGPEGNAGEVRRDLFENDVYLVDPEMVRVMAETKMQRSRLFKAVQGEGWLWLECRVAFEHADKKSFGEIQRVHQEPNKAQAKQIDGLQKKIDVALDSPGRTRSRCADCA